MWSWCSVRALRSAVESTARVARCGAGSRAHSRSEAGSEAGEASPLRRLVSEAASFGEATRGAGELQWATQPYAARPTPHDEPPPRGDPRDAVVLLFPGQGSQFQGMGRRLLHIPAAKQLYEYASEVVGWDVLKVCLEGSDSELQRRCQTCVLVTSLAALEALGEQRPGAVQRARAALGFSLGEITALVFAGALTVERALRLVEIRAAAMSACCATRRGGMATLWLAADARLGAALHGARAAASEAGSPDAVCQVANYLYPHCKVVAADEEALQWLESNGRRFGVRRVARLAVDGAFHSARMAPAVPPLQQALRHCGLSRPRLAVLSNVDARPYRDAAHIARQLPKQMVSPVRWEQSLQRLFARAPGERFPLTVALGPGGDALRATLKQVNAKAWDHSIHVDV